MMVYRAIFVMGVSGCGKTTIGQMLARELNCPYYDGDDFHPEKNIQKMKSGKTLNDDDRYGWLVSLNKLALDIPEKEMAVISCSALKESYRKVLTKDLGDECLFIYLKGDYDVILHRMKSRDGHFMPAKLLRSQFEILEEPDYGIHVETGKSPDQSIGYILKEMKL